MLPFLTLWNKSFRKRILYPFFSKRVRFFSFLVICNTSKHNNYINLYHVSNICPMFILTLNVEGLCQTKACNLYMIKSISPFVLWFWYPLKKDLPHSKLSILLGFLFKRYLNLKLIYFSIGLTSSTENQAFPYWWEMILLSCVKYSHTDICICVWNFSILSLTFWPKYNALNALLNTVFL